jgi:hypothetical protein
MSNCRKKDLVFPSEKILDYGRKDWYILRIAVQTGPVCCSVKGVKSKAQDIDRFSKKKMGRSGSLAKLLNNIGR